MLTALRGRILMCWPAVLGDSMAIDLITGTLLVLSDLCCRRPLLLSLLFRKIGEDGLPTKNKVRKLRSEVATAANPHKFRAPSDLELCVCVRRWGLEDFTYSIAPSKGRISPSITSVLPVAVLEGVVFAPTHVSAPSDGASRLLSHHQQQYQHQQYREAS